MLVFTSDAAMAGPLDTKGPKEIDAASLGVRFDLVAISASDPEQT